MRTCIYIKIRYLSIAISDYISALSSTFVSKLRMRTVKPGAMEICISSLYMPRAGPDLMKNFRTIRYRFGFEGVVVQNLRLSKASVGLQIMRALGDDTSGSKSNQAEGWDPGLEIQVPSEQRPVNELAALKGGALYSWAELNRTEFVVRLGGLWVFFFAILSGPIAAGSFEPSRIIIDMHCICTLHIDGCPPKRMSKTNVNPSSSSSLSIPKDSRGPCRGHEGSSGATCSCSFDEGISWVHIENIVFPKPLYLTLPQSVSSARCFSYTTRNAGFFPLVKLILDFEVEYPWSNVVDVFPGYTCYKYACLTETRVLDPWKTSN
eukprot:Gb_21043 [translate_table: standard]